MFSNLYITTHRQGSLNDCWVIAAITILATETPEIIRDIFITKEIQESGKYHLKLFSYGKMKIVELDDYFPCYNYTVNYLIFIEKLQKL